MTTARVPARVTGQPHTVDGKGEDAGVQQGVEHHDVDQCPVAMVSQAK